MLGYCTEFVRNCHTLPSRPDGERRVRSELKVRQPPPTRGARPVPGRDFSMSPCFRRNTAGLAGVDGTSHLNGETKTSNRQAEVPSRRRTTRGGAGALPRFGTGCPGNRHEEPGCQAWWRAARTVRERARGTARRRCCALRRPYRYPTVERTWESGPSRDRRRS